MYYIWQCPAKTTWISIFELQRFRVDIDEDKCIFVGEPQKLLEEYDEERD